MGNKVLTKRVNSSIGKVLALLLLVMHIAGPSNLELVHSVVHSHDVVVTHSEEQEADPCHRLVYHYDTEQSCDHDSHFIVSDKCQMCDLVYNGDQTTLSNVAFATGELLSEQFDFYKLNPDSFWAVMSSSRAPPALA